MSCHTSCHAIFIHNEPNNYCIWLLTCVMIYSTFIIQEVFVDFKSNCYWTILEQLQSHQHFITSSIETTNIVVTSPIMPRACLLMARRVFGFVWKTFFIHQSKVLSILADEISKSWEQRQILAFNRRLIKLRYVKLYHIKNCLLLFAAVFVLKESNTLLS